MATGAIGSTPTCIPAHSHSHKVFQMKTRCLQDLSFTLETFTCCLKNVSWTSTKSWLSYNVRYTPKDRGPWPSHSWIWKQKAVRANQYKSLTLWLSKAFSGMHRKLFTSGGTASNSPLFTWHQRGGGCLWGQEALYKSSWRWSYEPQTILHSVKVEQWVIVWLGLVKKMCLILSSTYTAKKNKRTQ